MIVVVFMLVLSYINRFIVLNVAKVSREILLYIGTCPYQVKRVIRLKYIYYIRFSVIVMNFILIY